MPIGDLEDALKHGVLLVATAQHKVVGFAMARELAGVLHLMVMAVHPDHGCRGLGRGLAMAIIDEAARRRYPAVALTTFEDLPWNGPFYREAGFRVLSDSELTPTLRDFLAQEKRLGMTNRVAMQHAIAPPSPEPRPRTPSKLLFLPGASGNVGFWQPVADRLVHPGARQHLGWPGFGPTPPDPRVGGIDDLVARVVAEIDQPTALIAQSMGGVIAMRAALERPDLVTHVVLTVTSGGIDITDLGACDWRPEFFAANPAVPRWFSSCTDNLAPSLHLLTVPALLLWGDADPISPVAVGQRLASLLPHATLHVAPGGTHELANLLAAGIAPLIDEHLSK